MSSADPRIRQYKKEEATIRKLVFVLLLLLVLLGFYLLYSHLEERAAPEPLLPADAKAEAEALVALPEPTTTPAATTPATFPVHLAGAVARPGVYYVTEGTILDTVLREAGGFSIVADTTKVNLAMSLAAHQYVYVPELGEETVPTPVSPIGGESRAASTEPDKVNINTADEAELTKLSGVGPSTAQKIIAYREANGPFQALEDLMNVPGIKEGRFAGLKDFITLD